MTDAPETVLVETRRVSCDGGGGALGHPRVYYTIGVSGFVECGYCDRRFVLVGAEADASETVKVKDEAEG
ncbi:MAG: zinc-finger domain-containing protein [Pseudomonadota bacterium]